MRNIFLVFSLCLSLNASAAIVSSSIVQKALQKDGRSYVIESHTDGIGGVHVREYLADPEADTKALMTAYATLLGDNLKASEMQSNYDRVLIGLYVFSFNHSTQAENLAYVRNRYFEARQLVACQIAKFLLTITDDQLKTIFNTKDLTALKVRLQTKAAYLDCVNVEVGE